MQKICGKLRKLFHTLWKSRLFVLLPVENLEYTLCNLWKTRSLCSITCGKVRTLALLPVENLSLPPRGKPLFIGGSLSGSKTESYGFAVAQKWVQFGPLSVLHPSIFSDMLFFIVFFAIFVGFPNIYYRTDLFNLMLVR
jgi:hypothetical protein